MSIAEKALGATFTKYLNVATPLALPSIEAYWRADDQALGAVSSWTDLTGHGHALLQATGGSQPINTAAQINGHNAIVFDGTDDFLDTGASGLVISQPSERWLVFKRVSFVAGDFILETGNSTLSNYVQDQTATTIRSSSSGGTTVDVTVGAVGSWMVVRWTNAAGAGASSISVNNGTASAWTSAQGPQRLILGGKVGGTLCPNIAVAECFFTKAALTSAESTMVYNYLRTKYALPV